MDSNVFLAFGLAFGLGLLVGLEREWAGPSLAGIRTFPLIAIAGAACGLLGGDAGELLLAAGLLAVAGMFWIGNRALLDGGAPRADPGLTTEMAGLLMFLVGAALTRGHTALAVVVSGGTAALLHSKTPLHGFVHRLGEEDVRALVRLVLLGMVILPVLPNRGFGPYAVWNPQRIWWMVVLIVGISLAAYVAHRLLAPQRGTLLAGVFGGLISSTATTVSYARRSRSEPDEAPAAAVVVVLAAAVVFARLLLEVGIVARGLLPAVGPPILVLLALVGALGGVLFWRSRGALTAARDDEQAPTDLKAPIGFALLYAVVLFAAAAVQAEFGDRALYAVAAVSGLTDMDAITLSTAELMRGGSLPVAVGWRVIVVGALSNLVFKGALIAALGDRRLRRAVLPCFGLALAGGAALLAFWPD